MWRSRYFLPQRKPSDLCSQIIRLLSRWIMNASKTKPGCQKVNLFFIQISGTRWRLDLSPLYVKWFLWTAYMLNNEVMNRVLRSVFLDLFTRMWSNSWGIILEFRSPSNVRNLGYFALLHSHVYPYQDYLGEYFASLYQDWFVIENEWPSATNVKSSNLVLDVSLLVWIGETIFGRFLGSDENRFSLAWLLNLLLIT